MATNEQIARSIQTLTWASEGARILAETGRHPNGAAVTTQERAEFAEIAAAHAETIDLLRTVTRIRRAAA